MEIALATTLLIVGVLVLLASLDDLIVDVLSHVKLRQPRFKTLRDTSDRSEQATVVVQQPAIAIFVANWHEADVLGPMVERNLANFGSTQVRFVLGVYPNDVETRAVAEDLARRFPSTVEVVVNRRNGPTSKGQMLNEMFWRVFAQPSNAPDLVVLHDSEDVIAPRSFEVYAREAAHHAMIQIPIFSIDSRSRSLVGATYMEEFAERHTSEMLLRQELGAFVPSAGVGTCLRKDLILYFLSTRGHVLEPGSVTEDYILGAQAHLVGFSTAFAAYREGPGSQSPIVATLEYFPKAFWSSVRQRTRWTYGIGFESARRVGWFGSAWNRFFLYRDRKGAIANFLPLISLVILAACLMIQPDYSAMADWQKTLLIGVLAMNSLNIVVRVMMKALALKTIYHTYDIVGLLARWPIALIINALAAARAWRSFIVESGLASKPIAWAKTQHEIPVTFSLSGARLAPAEASAGRTSQSRSAWTNRSFATAAGGAVTLGILGLIVAGGLRVLEPLLAPAPLQVAGSDPDVIDNEERRIVEGLAVAQVPRPSPPEIPITSSNPTAQPKHEVPDPLPATTIALAEFSLASAAMRDERIIAAAVPPQPLDATIALAALEESEPADEIAAVDAEHSGTQELPDPIKNARLIATATSMAEFSLANAASEDARLIGRAREPAVVDGADVLVANAGSDDAFETLQTGAITRPPQLVVQSDEVVRIAEDGIARAALSDTAILTRTREAQPANARPPLIAQPEVRDGLQRDLPSTPPLVTERAERVEDERALQEKVKATLAAIEDADRAILKKAGRASRYLDAPPRQKFARVRDKDPQDDKPTKLSPSGVKKSMATASKVTSRGANTIKSKARPAQGIAVAQVTFPQPTKTSNVRRASTHLRRACESPQCRARPATSFRQSLPAIPRPS